MSSCKDCLHYEACKGTYNAIWTYSEPNDFGNEHYADMDDCHNFTDRSEWTHLPCKVGDKIYYLRRNPKTFEWHIQETKVHSIDIRCNGSYIYVNYGLSCYAPKEIGKRLFLTREEAEKTIEKIKKEGKKNKNDFK